MTRATRVTRPSRFLLGWAASLVLIGATAAASDPLWSIIESTDQRVSIEVHPPQATWVSEGGESGRVRVAGADGQPLPSFVLPVAMPPEGDVRVRASIRGPREPLEHRIDEVTGASAALASLRPGWRQADPLGHVQYRVAGWAGSQRQLVVRIQPVRPDRAGWLQTSGGMRVDIEFTASPLATEGASRPRAGGEGPFASLHDRVVINPKQAAAWRRPPARAALPTSSEGFHSAGGDWIRMAITTTGVYQLTAYDLRRAGIHPSVVPLDSLRLFCGEAEAIPEDSTLSALPGWMNQCALWVEDDGDGVWDEDTRVTFVGSGPDGWRDQLGLPDAPGDPYYSHPYSRHFTYWLSWGGAFDEPPLRMDYVDAAPVGDILDVQGRGRLHVEQNTLFDPRPREADLPWERFFYTDVQSSANPIPATVLLKLPGSVAGTDVDWRVSLWGRTFGGAASPDHYVKLSAGADTFSTLGWDGTGRGLGTGTTSASAVRETLRVHVPSRYLEQDLLSDRVYLAWIEAEYRQGLRVSADSIASRIPSGAMTRGGARIYGLSDSTDWVMLDVSDFRHPRRLEPRIHEVGGWGVVADFYLPASDLPADIVFLRAGEASSPATVERRSWTDRTPLRRRTEAIDYIIVCGDEFREAADSLAAHRRRTFRGASGDTLREGRVAVVTIGEVFDEFSWGQHDPTALRNFLIHARDHWRGESAWPTLSHVLLIGNAYYDPRGYLASTAEDIVPSYMFFSWRLQSSPYDAHFIADDWMALLDGPDDNGIDLAIGRFPVGSEAEAWAMVEKIIHYETEPPLGPWRTRLMLTADDICQGQESDGLGWQHSSQSEGISRDWMPPDGHQEKVYLYEYGTECRYNRKPEATADLISTLSDGALVLNFVGHGSETQLADEHLLEIASVGSIDNDDRPFLMITASCAVGKFAHGGEGLALEVLRLPGRGALGVVSASSLAFSGPNYALNCHLLGDLFPDETVIRPRTIGPSLLAAKWRNPAGQAENDLRYNLLGDPGVRLAAPELEIALTLEQSPEVGAGPDTLARGAPAVLRGTVVDSPDFAGTVEFVVLDSEIQRKPVPGNSQSYYMLPGSRIVSLGVEVQGGEFEGRFFVPTSLRSGDRGWAKIFAYAVSEEGDHDAAGALPRLFIPETAQATVDTVGPTIDLDWVEPDAPRETGSLLRATLTDSSGVYVAGLSPSRAVVLSIANAPGRVLAATDLSEQVTFGDDYREATVEYAIPSGLPTHEPLTLVLAASDNVGRRGSEEIEFVLSEGDATLSRLLSSSYPMPNPMETETYLLFEISRIADLEIGLYTVSGRLIRSLSADQVTPESARRQGVHWDGLDEDGDRVANGLYFYRVRARDGAGRTEERIERLVVAR